MLLSLISIALIKHYMTHMKLSPSQHVCEATVVWEFVYRREPLREREQRCHWLSTMSIFGGTPHQMAQPSLTLSLVIAYPLTAVM